MGNDNQTLKCHQLDSDSKDTASDECDSVWRSPVVSQHGLTLT